MSIEHIQARFAPTCANLSRQIAELELAPSALANHQDQVRELEGALAVQDTQIKTLGAKLDTEGRGLQPLGGSGSSSSFLTKITKDASRSDLVAKRHEVYSETLLGLNSVKELRRTTQDLLSRARNEVTATSAAAEQYAALKEELRIQYRRAFEIPLSTFPEQDELYFLAREAEKKHATALEHVALDSQVATLLRLAEVAMKSCLKIMSLRQYDDVLHLVSAQSYVNQAQVLISQARVLQPLVVHEFPLMDIAQGDSWMENALKGNTKAYQHLSVSSRNKNIIERLTHTERWVADALAETDRRLALDRNAASLASTKMQETNDKLDAKRKEIMEGMLGVLPAYTDM